MNEFDEEQMKVIKFDDEDQKKRDEFEKAVKNKIIKEFEEIQEKQELENKYTFKDFLMGALAIITLTILLPLLFEFGWCCLYLAMPNYIPYPNYHDSFFLMLGSLTLSVLIRVIFGKWKRN